jgi:hypothetical protein
MNAKEVTKLRQLHRRTTDENLDKLKQEMLGMVRMPPRFFPARLWFWLESKFLKV